MNAKRHLQGSCNEKGRGSVLHLAQGSKCRDVKHGEEITEKAEQFNLESVAESL